MQTRAAMLLRLCLFAGTLCVPAYRSFGVFDFNGDGISDLWQEKYNAYGLDPDGDADGDGSTNRDESLLATNPFNPQSKFGLTSWRLFEDLEVVELQFPAVNGNRYNIQSSATVESSAWETEKQVQAGHTGDLTVFCPVDMDAQEQVFLRVELDNSDFDQDGLSAWEEHMLGLSDFDANSNGVKPGGDAAWVVEQLYGGTTFTLLDGTTELPAIPWTMEEASRLLAQATYGPTYEEIEAVAAQGLGPWLDEQFSMPATLTAEGVAAELAVGEPDEWSLWRKGWWNNAITAPDQLRQRMGFALSEIFVISGQGEDLVRGEPDSGTTYFDILLKNAFGSYRTLLYDVSLSVPMGWYLSHFRNDKADPSIGRFPDENYAREIMQLFSIGLWELNPDGTRQLDEHGDPIPTYTNFHIRELAKVFTGLNWGDTGGFFWYNYDVTIPMKMFDAHHEPGPKVLVNGGFIPDGQTGLEDISDAIDHLAAHHNVGPFIGRLLIQRFVKSHPSPEYIRRVATAFADDGHGHRGNFESVLRAILLDPEARSSAYMSDPTHGKVREPYITYVHLGRAFDAVNTLGNYPLATQAGMDQMGQIPLHAPTVFNFYLPDHQPFGPLRDAGIDAPEFEILSSTVILEWPNILHRGIQQGMDPWTLSAPRVIMHDYSDEFALVGNSDALIDRLDLMFTYGSMSSETKAIIKSAMDDHGVADIEKMWIAIYLTMTSPEFVVLK